MMIMISSVFNFAISAGFMPCFLEGFLETVMKIELFCCQTYMYEYCKLKAYYEKDVSIHFLGNIIVTSKIGH